MTVSKHLVFGALGLTTALVQATYLTDHYGSYYYLAPNAKKLVKCVGFDAQFVESESFSGPGQHALIIKRKLKICYLLNKGRTIRRIELIGNEKYVGWNRNIPLLISQAMRAKSGIFKGNLVYFYSGNSIKTEDIWEAWRRRHRRVEIRGRSDQ